MTGTPCSDSFQASSSAVASTAAWRLVLLRERAELRDPGRGSVVALRLGADDGLVDATGTALEDLPVAVDEEVVADVAPAVLVAVIAADRQHDGGAVLRRVGVRVDGVVHEADLHLAVGRRRARPALVGAPRLARDDRGRPAAAGRRAGLGSRRRPGDHGERPVRRPPQGGAQPVGRGRGAGRVDEPRAQAARPAAHAQLVGVGAAGPDRLGARAARVVGGHGGPRSPAPVRGAHADPRRMLRAGGRAPVQPDEIEALRRAHDRRSPPAVARALPALRVERLLELHGARDERPRRQRRGGEPDEQACGHEHNGEPAHRRINTTAPARVRPARLLAGAPPTVGPASATERFPDPCR